MCQWGESEDVEVTIVASLSSTGLAKRKVVGIDRCIAPLVRALDAAGILMTASCCGHGKASGRIDLEDGRVLTVNGPTFEPQRVAHETPAPRPAEEHIDAMIAHRWFAKWFGESYNGRDFAVKCAMADEIMTSLKSEAERPIAPHATKRASIHDTHCIHGTALEVDCQGCADMAATEPGAPTP